MYADSEHYINAIKTTRKKLTIGEIQIVLTKFVRKNCDLHSRQSSNWIYGLQA